MSVDAVAKDTGELVPIKSSLGLPGKVSRIGLQLPESLSFEQWENIGSTLHSVEGSIQWWIGDWLNYGEQRYGEKYSQALEVTDASYQTLAHAKSVASKFEFCRRRQNLSWSHHQEVASLYKMRRMVLTEHLEKILQDMLPPLEAA
jgi:hypothetical protein